MCDFISWTEYKGEILFLTSKELETDKGRALRAQLGTQYATDSLLAALNDYIINSVPAAVLSGNIKTNIK